MAKKKNSSTKNRGAGQLLGDTKPRAEHNRTVRRAARQSHEPPESEITGGWKLTPASWVARKDDRAVFLDATSKKEALEQLRERLAQTD